MHTYVAPVKVSRKGRVIPSALLPAWPGDKRRDVVSVVDANGELYVFPALKDPVRESRGMFAGEPDLNRMLLEERTRERGRG